jgi:hypothetical protein
MILLKKALVEKLKLKLKFKQNSLLVPHVKKLKTQNLKDIR